MKNIKILRSLALIYAAILVIFILLQLFSFEKFIVLLTNMQIFGGFEASRGVACLIAVCEVLSLPYLILKYPPTLLARISFFANIIIILFWLILTVYLNINGLYSMNLGLGGDTLTVHSNQILPLFFTAFGCLVLIIKNHQVPTLGKK